MDGGGRFSRSVTPRQAPEGAGRSTSWREERPRAADRFVIGAKRLMVALSGSRLANGGGIWLLAAFYGATAAYGVHVGGHVPAVVESGRDIADAAANVAGFKIRTVNLAGQNHVTPGEILATAGVKPTSSLPFLDAEAARTRLEELAWIKRATVQKFYPDRLDIQVVEREGYALWQKDGKINVIARDGTIIAPYSDDPRYVKLPIVVGEGAEAHVVEIVEALDLVPGVRDQVRAAIRVADRRWTLKLRNGIDVRLPETGVDGALASLAVLDRDKSLLSRDIIVVDLRLADRVTVRLSDAAYEARQADLKAKAKAAKKGGNT
ncbi:FtsQ-type POTRA domain-containing protein [Ancylobacter lacus]|nr:FtsQ-type POTRA domain-containing protein [Ancylobacter lacus]